MQVHQGHAGDGGAGRLPSQSQYVDFQHPHAGHDYRAFPQEPEFSHDLHAQQRQQQRRQQQQHQHQQRHQAPSYHPQHTHASHASSGNAGHSAGSGQPPQQRQQPAFGSWNVTDAPPQEQSADGAGSRARGRGDPVSMNTTDFARQLGGTGDAGDKDHMYIPYSDDEEGDEDDEFAVLQRYAANFGAPAEKPRSHQRSDDNRRGGAPPMPKPTFLRMPPPEGDVRDQAPGGANLSFNDLLQKALAATPSSSEQRQQQSQQQLEEDNDNAPRRLPLAQQHQQQHQQQQAAAPPQRQGRAVPPVAPQQVKFVTKAAETALRVDMEHEAAEVAEFEELERSILSQQQTPSPVQHHADEQQRQQQQQQQQQQQKKQQKQRMSQPQFSDVFSDNDEHEHEHDGGHGRGANAQDDGRNNGGARRPTQQPQQRGADRNSDPATASSKYVKGLFGGDEPSVDVAALRRREQAVADEERRLQKKIESVGREGAANRAEKRRLATLARNLENRERQLEADRKEFEEWSEGQRADVNVWRENQEEKIRKKLAGLERKAKLLAAAPSRAERGEIQKLEALVEDLRAQEKRQGDLAKQQLKRQQARISELTEREADLQEEIAVLVEERLTSPRASAGASRRSGGGSAGSGGGGSRKKGGRAAAAADGLDPDADADARQAAATGAAHKPKNKKKNGAASGKSRKNSLAAAAAEYERHRLEQSQQPTDYDNNNNYADYDSNNNYADSDVAGDRAARTEAVAPIDGQARVAQAYERRQQQQQPQRRGGAAQSTPLPQKNAQPHLQHQQQQPSYLDLKKAVEQQATQQFRPSQVGPFDVNNVAGDAPQPAGDFLHDDELLNEIVYEDRKIERQYASGRVEIVFRNGTQKQIFPDGNVIVKFTNGDMKRSTREGLVVYFYAEAQTTHTTHPDGTEVFEFPNGQSERHLTDGSKSIRFNDGTLKKISTSGLAESIFPDGTRLVEHPTGVRDIYMPDGTHTREQA